MPVPQTVGSRLSSCGRPAGPIAAVRQAVTGPYRHPAGCGHDRPEPGRLPRPPDVGPLAPGGRRRHPSPGPPTGRATERRVRVRRRPGPVPRWRGAYPVAFGDTTVLPAAACVAGVPHRCPCPTAQSLEWAAAGIADAAAPPVAGPLDGTPIQAHRRLNTNAAQPAALSRGRPAGASQAEYWVALPDAGQLDVSASLRPCRGGWPSSHPLPPVRRMVAWGHPASG
jgi:hypothetical protein